MFVAICYKRLPKISLRKKPKQTGSKKLLAIEPTPTLYTMVRGRKASADNRFMMLENVILAFRTKLSHEGIPQNCQTQRGKYPLPASAPAPTQGCAATPRGSFSFHGLEKQSDTTVHFSLTRTIHIWRARLRLDDWRPQIVKTQTRLTDCTLIKFVTLNLTLVWKLKLRKKVAESAIAHPFESLSNVCNLPLHHCSTTSQVGKQQQVNSYAKGSTQLEHWAKAATKKTKSGPE